MQISVRLIVEYRIKLHAPLIGLVNRQIFWVLIFCLTLQVEKFLKVFIEKILKFIVYREDYQGI